MRATDVLKFTKIKISLWKIYQIIKNKIIKGEIKENEKLPSIRNLSKDINVSINTIKKVYYKLEEEGYIYVKEKVDFIVEKLMT